ncbi:MAG: cupredoxin domain-containing protein [Candidatus Caldarchaeum sp.]
MKKAHVLALLAGIGVLSAVMLFFIPRQQPTLQTTPTQTTTTPAKPTVTTTLTQTAPAAEVIVSNPLGSSRNTSMTFSPQYVRLVIGVNNTVTWVNEDTVPHTVTSAARLFDYILQPGQTVRYTFTSPGVYEYMCTLHPWMTGKVEVVGRP